MKISVIPVCHKPFFAHPPYYMPYVSWFLEWELGFGFLDPLSQFGFGSINWDTVFLPSLSLQAAWLLKAVTCIDLTTLSGDDTPSNVHRMCFKAKHPIREDLLKAMDMHDKGMVIFVLFVEKLSISVIFFQFSVKHGVSETL